MGEPSGQSMPSRMLSLIAELEASQQTTTARYDSVLQAQNKIVEALQSKFLEQSRAIRSMDIETKVSLKEIETRLTALVHRHKGEASTSSGGSEEIAAARKALETMVSESSSQMHEFVNSQLSTIASSMESLEGRLVGFVDARTSASEESMRTVFMKRMEDLERQVVALASEKAEMMRMLEDAERQRDAALSALRNEMESRIAALEANYFGFREHHVKVVDQLRTDISSAKFSSASTSQHQQGQAQEQEQDESGRESGESQYDYVPHDDMQGEKEPILVEFSQEEKAEGLFDKDAPWGDLGSHARLPAELSDPRHFHKLFKSTATRQSSVRIPTIPVHTRDGEEDSFTVSAPQPQKLHPNVKAELERIAAEYTDPHAEAFYSDTLKASVRDGMAKRKKDIQDELDNLAKEEAQPPSRTAQKPQPHTPNTPTATLPSARSSSTTAVKPPSHAPASASASRARKG
eukprot:ANDGO_01411.mRNA.1 hypothetical protein